MCYGCSLFSQRDRGSKMVRQKVAKAAAILDTQLVIDSRTVLIGRNDTVLIIQDDILPVMSKFNNVRSLYSLYPPSESIIDVGHCIDPIGSRRHPVLEIPTVDPTDRATCLAGHISVGIVWYGHPAAAVSRLNIAESQV